MPGSEEAVCLAQTRSYTKCSELVHLSVGIHKSSQRLLGQDVCETKVLVRKTSLLKRWRGQKLVCLSFRGAAVGRHECC